MEWETPSDRLREPSTQGIPGRTTHLEFLMTALFAMRRSARWGIAMTDDAQASRRMTHSGCKSILWSIYFAGVVSLICLSTALGSNVLMAQSHSQSGSEASDTPAFCNSFTDTPGLLTGPDGGIGESLVGGSAFQSIRPDWRWVFLPQGFLYHTYWASTAEPRLATRAFNELGGLNSLDSQIGGRIGIVRFGNPDSEEGFQLDLLGGANLRQNTDTYDWDMTGTDYRFDIPLTYRRGAHAWKFGFYHVSSHMGDEFLKYHPSVERIDFYRHSLFLGYSYYVTPEFRVYGEIDYAIRHDFSEPWHLQFGFDWGPVQPTGIRGAPFLAINGHLREELGFGGNVSAQTGWAWKGKGLGAGTLRTGLHYYNGGSPQFSFYRESEQQIGWGLWYDF